MLSWRNPPIRKKGFILLEVALTVSILSIGIVFVLQSYRASLQASRRIHETSQAIWLAQGTLADLAFQASNQSDPLESKEEDVPDSPFHWTVDTEPVEETKDRLTLVRLTIWRNVPGAERQEVFTVTQEFLQKK